MPGSKGKRALFLTAMNSSTIWFYFRFHLRRAVDQGGHVWLSLRLFLKGVLMMLVLVACSDGNQTDSATLHPGDVTRESQWFTEAINGAPPCSTCHTLDGTPLVGPSLEGFGVVASTRLTNTSAEEYTYTSIVRPADFQVNGFGNLMYNQYERRLTQQQIADLIAYLLTL
jgi:cytochrome c553